MIIYYGDTFLIHWTVDFCWSVDMYAQQQCPREKFVVSASLNFRRICGVISDVKPEQGHWLNPKLSENCEKSWWGKVFVSARWEHNLEFGPLPIFRQMWRGKVSFCCQTAWFMPHPLCLVIKHLPSLVTTIYNPSMHRRSRRFTSTVLFRDETFQFVVVWQGANTPKNILVCIVYNTL